MATYTENYNLEKPAQTDMYDIDVQNSNMDTIDETLGNINENAINYADAVSLGIENIIGENISISDSSGRLAKFDILGNSIGGNGSIASPIEIENITSPLTITSCGEISSNISNEFVFEIPIEDDDGNTYELCKVGEISDRIFLDTDGTWKLEQKIGNLNASDILCVYNSTDTEYPSKQVFYVDMVDENAILPFSAVLSDKLTSYEYDPSSSYCCTISNDTSTYPLVILLPSGTLSDASGMSAWLESIEADIKIAYATPKIITLSTATQEILNNISIEKDTANIFSSDNDVMPSFDVSYITNTKLGTGLNEAFNFDKANSNQIYIRQSEIQTYLVPLTASTVAQSETSPFIYYKNSFGEVIVQGMVVYTNHRTSSTIGTLPVGFRPIYPVQCKIVGAFSDDMDMYIDTDGVITNDYYNLNSHSGVTYGPWYFNYVAASEEE